MNHNAYIDLLLERELDEEIKAYHGSPHKFEVFSTDKMGTGTGKHDFGWGLYFTDNKEIAKHYSMSKIKKNRFFINGKELHGNKAWAALIISIWAGSDLDTIISKAEVATKYNEKDQSEVIKYVKELFNKNITQNLGNVYRVILHKGKSPNQYDYLQWDKMPSYKQMQKITHEASLMSKDNPVRLKILDSLEINNGERVYRGISTAYGDNDKLASEFLLKAGIDGIEYPTETISGITARNYVVFDPKAVTIEKEPI